MRACTQPPEICHAPPASKALPSLTSRGRSAMNETQSSSRPWADEHPPVLQPPSDALCWRQFDLMPWREMWRS